VCQKLIKKILFLLIFVSTITIIDASAQEAGIFHLTVKSSPNIIFLSGSGDYAAGKEVTLDPAPKTWQDYSFIGWRVDGRWSVENPPTIRMDNSHTVEAVYEKTGLVGGLIIDTIPRVAEVTVDGTIYLPDELPLTFSWPAGSKHVISIPAAVGKDPQTRYVFDSWKDQDTKILRTVMAGDADDYIALYKTQYFLKSISEYGTVIGGGWQDEGAPVSFEIESDVVVDPKDENIRYIFNSWDQGDYLNSPQNSIDFVTPITIKANWNTEYKLNLQTNVPDYELSGGGWHAVGKNVFLIAEEEIKSPNSDVNYVFDQWVSKGINPVVIPNAHSPSTSITLDTPYTIEAQYKKSYQVNVWTPFGTAVGGGFYPDGSVAEIKVQKTEAIVEPNQIRKVFTGWNTGNARIMDLGGPAELDPDGKLIGGENLLLFADRPLNVTANWKTQYYLDIESPEGLVTGEGWYDVGKIARIAIQNPSTSQGFWTSYNFERWIGDYEEDSPYGTVIVNKPKVVIAQWKQDSTPGIYNSLILAGLGISGVVTYSKTHNRFSFGKNVRELIDESKPFEKFFSLRKRSPSSEQHPSFYSKPKKKKAVLNWLMGKD